MGLGPATRDLAAFIVSSLSVDDRRSALDDLLHAYSVQLAERGVNGCTRTALREHVRLALLRYLAGVVNWLGSPGLTHLEGRERAVADAAIGDGRLVAALIDENVDRIL